MSRMRLLLVACALQPVAVALAASSYVVDQRNRTFVQKELHIKTGESVKFRNSDDFLHHLYVRSPTFSFNSGEQQPGRDVDVQFPVKGQFEVRCEIHPRMVLNLTAD